MKLNNKIIPTRLILNKTKPILLKLPLNFFLISFLCFPILTSVNHQLEFGVYHFLTFLYNLDTWLYTTKQYIVYFYISGLQIISIMQYIFWYLIFFFFTPSIFFRFKCYCVQLQFIDCPCSVTFHCVNILQSFDHSPVG